MIFVQLYLSWTVIKMLHYFKLATRYRQALLINTFQFQFWILCRASCRFWYTNHSAIL